MAKTAFDKVLEKFQKGKVSVEMADMKEPEKPKKGEPAVDADWVKPSLYITDELPGVSKDSNVGDTVYIVCQCHVTSLSQNSYTENGKTKTSYEARLVVDEMAQLF